MDEIVIPLNEQAQLAIKPQQSLKTLLTAISNCRECTDLPCGPRPIVSAHVASRILIIGQAPGKRVHETGIAWNDPSGDRLRDWMGIDSETFYNESLIAIVPMGFCYPGRGKSGDRPPRPECAPLWHAHVLDLLTSVELTVLIGTYAQRRYLAQNSKHKNLTQTVANWKQHCPTFLPLPHPSPRNNFWLKKNPWFSDEVLPYLRQRVRQILN